MVKLEKVLILTFTKSMKAKALETKKHSQNKYRGPSQTTH